MVDASPHVQTEFGFSNEVISLETRLQDSVSREIEKDVRHEQSIETEDHTKRRCR
jgi:hypothetical protein